MLSNVGSYLDNMYHIDGVIGSGGFGVVLSAYERLSGDAVAIKIVSCVTYYSCDLRRSAPVHLRADCGMNGKCTLSWVEGNCPKCTGLAPTMKLLRW